MSFRITYKAAQNDGYIGVLNTQKGILISWIGLWIRLVPYGGNQKKNQKYKLLFYLDYLTMKYE